MYCWRLLFLRCCVLWCCQRKLWCLLGLLVLLPIVLVVARLVVAFPVGIVAIVWVIPLRPVVMLLLVCCVQQVVDRCPAVFSQVTWLATSVPFCHWVLSLSFVVVSLVLSLPFVCSLHRLPALVFLWLFFLPCRSQCCSHILFLSPFLCVLFLVAFLCLFLLFLCILLQYSLEPVLHCSLR